MHLASDASRTTRISICSHVFPGASASITTRISSNSELLHLYYCAWIKQRHFSEKCFINNKGKLGVLTSKAIFYKALISIMLRKPTRLGKFTLTHSLLRILLKSPFGASRAIYRQSILQSSVKGCKILASEVRASVEIKNFEIASTQQSRLFKLPPSHILYGLKSTK